MCSPSNFLILDLHTRFIENPSGSNTSNQEGQIAIASSVTVFIVASFVFFIIGFLCRHFCWKERKMANHEVITSEVTPDYDDVQHEHELELKENVAYAPVRS